jgi:hypothetical protein
MPARVAPTTSAEADPIFFSGALGAIPNRQPPNGAHGVSRTVSPQKDAVRAALNSLLIHSAERWPSRLYSLRRMKYKQPPT